MPAVPSSLCYRFGRFELQPDKRRLLASGAPVEVGSRAFDLLVTLVERDGCLVTKEELLERVWPKVIVEENTIHRWLLGSWWHLKVACRLMRVEISNNT
jgi:DNA-binding winged helix-turn-helix (wHTH) protein